MSKQSEIAHLVADVREHILYLKELGVESLDAELPAIEAVPDEGAGLLAATSLEERQRPAAPAKQSPPADLKAPAAATPPKKRAGSRIASLPSLAKREPRKADAEIAELAKSVASPEVAVKSPQAESSAATTDAPPATEESIESIRQFIGNCTRCPLHTGRTQVVHSTGNFQAELMFVGEAPGADEDIKGEPFVGRAGQLLTKIIESIGLSREEVFIGNINRCRPPGNRQPLPEEAATCKPFLLREIAVVKPRVIVVLGAHAAHNLLEVKTPISKLRGHFHEYHGVQVMPTFHPAYLLRDPHKKREVWEDMKKVREFLATAV